MARAKRISKRTRKDSDESSNIEKVAKTNSRTSPNSAKSSSKTIVTAQTDSKLVKSDVEYPEHVKKVLEKRGDQPIRLYADGIFDMFHYGHARALEQAKKAFPNTYLMVGCNSDALTHKCKGRTVMHEKERYESLRHCRWVDEVIPGAPWVITEEFIEKHDIDFVCHDDLPYNDTSGQSSSGDVYAHLRDIGKFWPTQRTEGVSTSELIVRIIREYDTFVRRNLSRGYSGKEMNVPYVKEKQIQFDMAIDKAKNATQTFVRRWSDKAEELQDEFLQIFSKEGALRRRWRETRRRISGQFDTIFGHTDEEELGEDMEKADEEAVRASAEDPEERVSAA